MYADDLGFGDVSCYGATRIPTPNVDRLAAAGLRFTDGYATAATCTPSRYSLLTGSYPWRNERAAILAGDAPMIIPEGMPTLPSVLKKIRLRDRLRRQVAPRPWQGRPRPGAGWGVIQRPHQQGLPLWRRDAKHRTIGNSGAFGDGIGIRTV
jgi:hypothetical protein